MFVQHKLGFLIIHTNGWYTCAHTPTDYVRTRPWHVVRCVCRAVQCTALWRIVLESLKSFFHFRTSSPHSPSLPSHLVPPTNTLISFLASISSHSNITPRTIIPTLIAKRPFFSKGHFSPQCPLVTRPDPAQAPQVLMWSPRRRWVCCALSSQWSSSLSFNPQ